MHILYTSTHELKSCHLCGTCNVVWWLNSVFQDNIQIISIAPWFLGNACSMWISRAMLTTFIIIIIFSLLLDFNASISVLSKQPFNFTFPLNLFLVPLLIFILFKMIYKINFFFQLHPPLIFLSVRFGDCSFYYYLFCFESSS